MGNFIIKIVDNSTPYIIKVASNNGGGSGTITGAQVVSALGYTPYNASNPLGFITASSLVGYATESYVNSQGFLTSISGLNNSLLTNDSNFITASSLSGYATESYVNAQGFITASSLTPYLTITTAASTYQPIGTYLTSISGLNNSLLVNDSGFITASALSPYLLSTTASTTYQQILVSGTNLKTINGSSLLGSGDITISGGGSYTAGIGLTLTGSSFSSNLSTGISGGQSAIGGTASGNNLTLSSTSHATKGKILFGTSAYDEVNNRLGIGTATPLNKLDVYGDLTIGNGAGAALKYNSTVAGGGSEFVIQPIYSGTSIVSIRPAAGSSLAPALRLTDSSTDAGGSHAFSFGTGSASLPANAWNFFSTITGNANTNSWPIYFGVSNPSKGRVVAMTIDNTTNVGIGTTSPGYKLDIQGAAAETSLTNTTNNNRISFGFPSGSGGEPSLSAFTTGVTNGRIFQRQNSTKDVFMGDIDANGGGVHIRTNGNDSLNILSGGNVGIGQSSPTAYLHLKAGTATAGTAPLKLTSGTNLTTPENGTFEYDGTNLYFTVGGVRKTVTLI